MFLTFDGISDNWSIHLFISAIFILIPGITSVFLFFFSALAVHKCSICQGF